MSKPIISFVMILLSVGFAFLYVKPKYDHVQSNRTAIVDLNETLKRADTIKALIEETKKDLENVDPNDRTRFATFLPETMDTIRFANTLQHIGALRGLVLSGIKVEERSDAVTTSVSTGEQSKQGVSTVVENTFSMNRGLLKEPGASHETPAPSGDKRYKTNKATFSVTTSYGNFLKLLYDLERSLGLINVTSLSFTAVADSSSQAERRSSTQLYQYAVELETYSLK